MSTTTILAGQSATPVSTKIEILNAPSVAARRFFAAGRSWRVTRRRLTGDRSASCCFSCAFPVTIRDSLADYSSRPVLRDRIVLEEGDAPGG